MDQTRDHCEMPSVFSRNKSIWNITIDYYNENLLTNIAPMYTCQYCGGEFPARLKDGKWVGKYCDRACQRAHQKEKKEMENEIYI